MFLKVVISQNYDNDRSTKLQIKSVFISPIPLLVLRYISKQVTALKHSDTLGKIPGPGHRMPLICHGIAPCPTAAPPKAKHLLC